MSAPILIPAGPYSEALVRFVAASALSGCTTTTGVDTGWEVARRWPGLSTGEDVLWRILRFAARGARRDAYLEFVAFRHRLDDGQRAVAADLMAALGMGARL